jgi:hypothetical protein
MRIRNIVRGPWALGAAVVLTGLAAVGLGPEHSNAASSRSCLGGGFSVLGLSGDRDAKIAPGQIPAKFLVKGKYVEFTVVASTLGIENYTFTGAPNPEDMTGGRRLVVFASKTPDHRGLSLSSEMRIRMSDDDLRIERSGGDLKMKIQAKDCAAGGLFQMEPEREDGAKTRITHTLASDAFYFDNPNFRAREGDEVKFGKTKLVVGPRNNIGGDVAPNFVGRDSAQVASRVLQGCVNTVPAPRKPGGVAQVDHCGGVSVWDVASGGRMGAVFGEDAVEVSPAATDCVEDCQAQNRVRGKAVVLGFPFPVPQESRFKPRFPA